MDMREKNAYKILKGEVEKNFRKRWTMSARNWGKAINQFAILYSDRMP
jgi:transposase-like protein